MSLGIAACCLIESRAADYELEPDSLRIEQLQEVVIDGARGRINEPFAVTNIERSELDSYSKTGRELPFLFSKTPA